MHAYLAEYWLTSEVQLSLLERIETSMRVLEEFRGQLHWGTNAARFKEFRYLFYYLATAIISLSLLLPRPSGV